jgi:chitinase
VDTTGTLVIPPNRIGTAIAVVILGDKVHESSETLLVTIDSPTHATVGDGDAVLTIHDDD